MRRFTEDGQGGGGGGSGHGGGSFNSGISEKSAADEIGLDLEDEEASIILVHFFVDVALFGR